MIQDPVEKELVSELNLAYQSGKGSRRLVPVLFPKDTLPAIKKLLSERKRCGVCNDNEFLFPNLGMSDDHVIGWSSIQSITKLMGDRLVKDLSCSLQTNFVIAHQQCFHCWKYLVKDEKYSTDTWVIQSK